MRNLQVSVNPAIARSMVREIAKPKRPPDKKALPRSEPLSSPRMLQLIEAADDIFFSKGYHAATMNEVAKAAGMSKKTVYQLVESKAELYGVLLAHHHAQLSFPVPRPGWTIREILIENVLCLARFFFSPRQIAIIRLIMAEYTHSPDLGRLFHQKRMTKAKHHLELCLLGASVCDAMSPAEVSELSAMLVGMALGEFHLGVLIGFRAMPSKPMLERRVKSAVDILLSGCGALHRPAVSLP